MDRSGETLEPLVQALTSIKAYGTIVCLGREDFCEPANSLEACWNDQSGNHGEHWEMKRSFPLKLLLTAVMRSDCHVKGLRLSISDRSASSPANSDEPDLGVLSLQSFTPQMLNYLVSRLELVFFRLSHGSNKIRRDTIIAVSGLLAAAKMVRKVIIFSRQSCRELGRDRI